MAYDPNDWTMVMIPYKTRDTIRQYSKDSGIKMWKIVDEAVNNYIESES